MQNADGVVLVRYHELPPSELLDVITNERSGGSRVCGDAVLSFLLLFSGGDGDGR